MSVEFLKKLLNAPSPSSEEARAGLVWREEAQTFADDVYTELTGNTFAVLSGGEPRVLLSGHIDEIGIMISHIDENGFLFITGIGGWDPQVLVGQRIRILGRNGDVVGVIGKKAIHLMEPDDRTKASKMEQLWIDIGVNKREEAEEKVRVGDVGVIESEVLELPNERIASRSLDNRIGAYVVLEALRLLAEDRPKATVAAVASIQEEVGLVGAESAAFSFKPSVAIAVDVNHSTDYPFSDAKKAGEAKLGGGPVLTRGSANSPVVHNMLIETAAKHDISYSVKVTPLRTGTDATAIYKANAGIASASIGIPNRYMHSPSEMIQMSDARDAAKLIAEFVKSIDENTSFIPY